MRLSFEFDLLSRLRRNKGQTDAEKRSNINVTNPFMGVFGRNTKSGVGITEEGALGLSAVYAAINKISSTLASLPLNLYRETAEGKVIAKEHPAFVILNLDRTVAIALDYCAR